MRLSQEINYLRTLLPNLLTQLRKLSSETPPSVTSPSDFAQLLEVHRQQLFSDTRLYGRGTRPNTTADQVAKLIASQQQAQTLLNIASVVRNVIEILNDARVLKQTALCEESTLRAYCVQVSEIVTEALKGPTKNNPAFGCLSELQNACEQFLKL